VSQQINLFNPIFLRQEKHFSALTMAQALGVILLGCVLLSVYTQFRLSLLNREAAEVDGQLATVQASLDKLNQTYSPRQKSKSIEDQVAAAEAEIKSLKQVLTALQSGDMGDTKGYSEYMGAFARQIVDGVWLTGFRIQGAGSEMEIDGRALQPDLVPAYIGRLGQESVFRGKSFETFEMHMPESKPSDKPGDAAPNPPPYIEFTLQSSSKEQANPSGATR
jgi:Tfp pilus assembly protein PilN